MKENFDHVRAEENASRIPPQLIHLAAVTICGEVDEHYGPCNECREDAQDILEGVYSFVEQPRSGEMCPACANAFGTCLYHTGVDDAILHDFAQVLRPQHPIRTMLQRWWRRFTRLLTRRR